METNHDFVKMTSSELAAIWNSYLNETLGNCTISYFLKDVQDPDLRAVLEYALDLANHHIQVVTDVFKKEEIPVPVGFTEQDVHLNAPRLFSDTFMLYYVQLMGAIGIHNYSVALPAAARIDIREFYTSCIQSSAELYNRASNVMQEKGLFIRSPYIPYPNQAEFIHKQHFLAGWIGKQRPLTAMEISSLFFNMYRNTVGMALLTGFSQVAQSEKVRHYLTRGAEIAKHHSAIFSDYLSEANLLAPMTWDLSVTTSIEAPFSDKLMMFHTAALNNMGISFYGTSIGYSARRDLAASYSRLILEAGELAEDGANILIDNGWLEKPPSVPDRRELTMG